MGTLSDLITAKDEPGSSQSSSSQIGSGYPLSSGPYSVGSQSMRSVQENLNVDRMPQLKQLVLGSEDELCTSHLIPNAEIQTGEECIYELLAEGFPVETSLGRAVDNLIVSWNQLFVDLSARSGFVPPTIEHIKEVAECAVRQLKDSCHELTGQFARVALEWRIAHPGEALAEDISNYDQAIMRQEALLERAAGTIQRRLGDFVNEYSEEF